MKLMLKDIMPEDNTIIEGCDGPGGEKNLGYCTLGAIFAKQPKSFGFELIATLDLDTYRSYTFNERAVWRRLSDGTLWTARTAGCSCPQRYEEVDALDRLFNLDEVREEYKKAIAAGTGWPTPQEWAEFRVAVEAAR